MMDQITIKDLEVYANHGLYKEEKALGQKFLVSAILSLDTKLAGVSDQMDYSVDYVIGSKKSLQKMTLT